MNSHNIPLQKRCVDCIPQAPLVMTKASSVSKLKRKIETPSPSRSSQCKMAKIATYDQIPSKFARPHNGRHKLVSIIYNTILQE